MAAEQLVAVTNAGFTSLKASIYSTYVEFQEDGSGSQAGLAVQFPDDNFTATYEFIPGQYPVKRGVMPVSGRSASAPLLGKPDRTVPVPNGNGTYTNVDEPATIYAKVKSLGANTNVRLSERP